MAEYIHLIGAEQVQSAASSMRTAASEMQSAASNFGHEAFQLRRAMEDHEQRMQAILEDHATRIEKAMQGSKA